MAATYAYTGSQLLLPLSLTLNLPLDQINFVFSQVLALLMSFAFRRYLFKEGVSTRTRHLASLVPGLYLGYFCFGSQLLHLVIMGTICYALMKTMDANVVQRVVLAVALICLSYLHMTRLICDYGGFTLDVSGTMMIAVQKVTSIAFNLHDGKAREERKLTPEQRRYALRKVPSVLEFASYLFQFQSLLCGPLLYYNDFIEFMDRKDIMRHITGTGDGHTIEEEKKRCPSCAYAVAEKLMTSIFFLVFMLTLGVWFPVSKLGEEGFLENSSFLSIYFYLLMTTTVVRFKYYHAWKLGESICNVSGIGFNGFDENDKPRWDLASNMDICAHEFSLNIRGTLEAWNKNTALWLRRTAYERVPNSWYPLTVTYALSSVWHGFYPGYYLAFSTVGLYTYAARIGRRCIRPRFQGSKEMAYLYDILTFIMTRLTIPYMVFPFMLLEFVASLKVYWSVFLYGHVACLFTIFVVPLLCPPPKNKDKNSVKKE